MHALLPQYPFSGCGYCTIPYSSVTGRFAEEACEVEDRAAQGQEVGFGLVAYGWWGAGGRGVSVHPTGTLELAGGAQEDDLGMRGGGVGGGVGGEEVGGGGRGGEGEGD